MKATFVGLKYGIKFLLESRIDKNTGEKIVENVPIIMSVSFNGQRIFQNVGIRTNVNICVNSGESEHPIPIESEQSIPV